MDDSVSINNSLSSINQNVADILSSDLIELNNFNEDRYEELGKELQLNTHAASTNVELQSHIKDAAQNYLKWKERRSKGWGKVGANIQEFSTCLANIADQYEPVVEMLSTYGGVPYVSAGFQALSALLIIPRMKSAIDDALITQLRQICDSFPQIQVLAEIYKSRVEIQVPLLQIHRGIVEWAKEATDYFSSRLHRLGAVLGGTRSKSAFAELKTVLTRISEWMNVYLHENVDNLQKQSHRVEHQIQMSQEKLELVNHKLMEQQKVLADVDLKLAEQISVLKKVNEDVTKSKEQLNELQNEGARRRQQEDVESYQAVERILRSGSTWDACAHDYSRLGSQLNVALSYKPNQYSGQRKTLAVSAHDFQNMEPFKRWMSRDDMKMLLISTQVASRPNTGYSWISSGPANFARSRSNEDSKDGSRIAFYSCHPYIWAKTEQSDKPNFLDVISDIVLQVLAMDKSLVRHQRFPVLSEDLVQRWRRKWRKGDLEDDQLHDCIGEVLSLASEDTPLYIIVDRLDALQEFTYNCWTILSLFEELARRSNRTKILVTLEDLESKFERECQNFGSSRDAVECHVGLKYPV